jgi:hypothetical protein
MLGFVLRNIESGFPMGARAIVCDADMLQASSAVRADTADQPTAIRHMTFSASGSSPTQESSTLSFQVHHHLSIDNVIPARSPRLHSCPSCEGRSNPEHPLPIHCGGLGIQLHYYLHPAAGRGPECVWPSFASGVDGADGGHDKLR